MYLPIFFPSKFTSYFFHLTTNMKAFDVLDVNCRLYFFFILFPSPLCLQNKITVCSGASLVIGEYLKVEFTKKKEFVRFRPFFASLCRPFLRKLWLLWRQWFAYTVLNLRIFREIADSQNWPFWHFTGSEFGFFVVFE